jgi:heme-degrading monooxygenase HmoA
MPTIDRYHLAQINVARAKADMESAVMQGFVSRLEEINTLADSSPGFVWRLQDECGDATSILVFDEPLLLVNMSVWESLEALKNYVYQSLHVEVLRNRNAWFNAMKETHLALWWIPAGHLPTTAEAKRKLEHIRQHGPTAEAFTFGKPYAAPSDD